jgi:DNA invertase Pin-like site-specific DNA recombinase
MTGRSAGIYVRISDDREGAGLGVDRQEQDCRALADRLGWDVVEVYVDNDLTAYAKSRRARIRPAYQRLQDDLRQGQIRAVVVWHTDRLHRTPRELEDFIDVCEVGEVPVETVQAGIIDLRTPAGRAVARTLCAWAFYESEHKSERVKRKYLELAQAGKVGNGGYRPFGYGPDRMTLVPEEATALRGAYEQVLSGRSLRSVAHDLTDRGFLTTTGRPWTLQALRYNLLSGRNAGLREHRRQIVGPALWPPIVDRDTWERTRALLQEPGRAPTRLDGLPPSTARKYLLTGFLVCGRCGHRLRPLRSSATQRFGCPPTKDGGCGGILVRYEPAHEHVVDLILDRLEREVDFDPDRPADPTTELLERIEAAEARLRHLADAFADDPDASPLELRAAGARIRRQISDARTAIARVAAQERVVEPLAARNAWLRGDYDLAQQRAVLAQLVERIDVLPASRRGSTRFEPGRLQITWR